ncbi:MAG TPA: MBL fold metallo-hydrolase [Fimbriimonadaceae bacterium]|nr:MBL fold metallo-hydrolase [Fimbriimonadaceae bacterium]
MVLKRFYNEKLAQASYLIGCSATGESVVIDPNRDADQYIEEAQREGLQITAVTETHIHADYLSGTRELAARTGATMYLSDEGTADWKYLFANGPGAKLVKDGDTIRIGNVRLDVVATPGHTPEHISFILTDEPASDQPLGVFSGDFIFVGDVGRPDLLERAANIKGTMEAGGRQLYGSLQRFSHHSDGLIIWPGHGAGSACGKSLGGVPVSSLGYEKAANWAFKVKSEQEFVDEVLTGQPDPPKYFAMMKKLNKEGPALLNGIKTPKRLDAEGVIKAVGTDAQVVDVRDGDVASLGFIRGTINIPLNKYFTTYSGWMLSYERPIILIAETLEEAEQATYDLAMIGLDNVTGWVGNEVFSSYTGELGTIPSVPASAMDGFDGVLLDVRSDRERAEGHVPGSIHVPLWYLSERTAEVPTDRKIAVYCGSGGRSRVAATVLNRHGICNLCNVTGGFGEYMSRGLPIQVGSGVGEPVAK